MLLLTRESGEHGEKEQDFLIGELLQASAFSVWPWGPRVRSAPAHIITHRPSHADALRGGRPHKTQRVIMDTHASRSCYCTLSIKQSDCHSLTLLRITMSIPIDWMPLHGWLVSVRVQMSTQSALFLIHANYWICKAGKDGGDGSQRKLGRTWPSQVCSRMCAWTGERRTDMRDG